MLPRLRDVMEDSMILSENLLPGEQVSLLSLDFKDAFKQLPVRHSEKRFLAGGALEGFFIYHAVLFGIRTGPLVLARMAALTSRATQSMFHATRCCLQTYVDDSLMLTRGTREQNATRQTRFLQISWSKRSLGNATGWIGAYIRLDNANKVTVTEVTVTEERLDDWKSLLKSLNRKPLVSRKLLVQFTGKMNWASGFLPQLKPFVRMLRTASRRSRTRDLCIIVRCSQLSGSSNFSLESKGLWFGKRNSWTRSSLTPSMPGPLGASEALGLKSGQREGHD